VVVGAIVQLLLALGLLGLGVMLALVGALVVAAVCGLAGATWLVWILRRVV
jgi:hypothetical protein